MNEKELLVKYMRWEETCDMVYLSRESKANAFLISKDAPAQKPHPLYWEQNNTFEA